jgi:hypothetical protein
MPSVSAAPSAKGKETAKSKEVPAAAETSKRRAYVKQTDVPRHTLNEALRVAQAISDEYAKQPTKPLDVAIALDLVPTGRAFEYLTGASVAYGLTEGGAQADQISLTELGRRVVAPLKEGDDLAAQREAFLRPRVIREFLTRYNNEAVPKDSIAGNVLKSMGVPDGEIERVLNLILDGALALGLIKEGRGGRKYVSLDAPGRPAQDGGQLGEPSLDPEGTEEKRGGEEEAFEEVGEGQRDNHQNSKNGSRPGAIFVGHGKKRGPLEKLQKILDQFKVPNKVVVELPNLGRPIPQKVKDTMDACNSAILIFTRDEKFYDADGNELWRPSENVVFELGAASYAYEDRVVILKEKGIDFPTNFSSVGHIEFDEDLIEAKAIDILKELIGFGLVKITTA